MLPTFILAARKSNQRAIIICMLNWNFRALQRIISRSYAIMNIANRLELSILGSIYCYRLQSNPYSSLIQISTASSQHNNRNILIKLCAYFFILCLVQFALHILIPNASIKRKFLFENVSIDTNLQIPH